MNDLVNILCFSQNIKNIFILKRLYRTKKVEFLDSLLSGNKVSLKDLEIITTYHDRCHTGRNAGLTPLYEEARRLLSQISKEPKHR
jgi:Fe-S oxidoreductase